MSKWSYDIEPDYFDESWTPSMKEYDYLVGEFYPDKITREIAYRMLELEQIVFTDQDRQSLVPEEYQKVQDPGNDLES